AYRNFSAVGDQKFRDTGHSCLAYSGSDPAIWPKPTNLADAFLRLPTSWPVLAAIAGIRHCRRKRRRFDRNVAVAAPFARFERESPSFCAPGSGGPELVPVDAEAVAQERAEGGDGEPDDGAGVAVDAPDERLPEAVDGERSG